MSACGTLARAPTGLALTAVTIMLSRIDRLDAKNERARAAITGNVQAVEDRAESRAVAIGCLRHLRRIAAAHRPNGVTAKSDVGKVGAWTLRMTKALPFATAWPSMPNR